MPISTTSSQHGQPNTAQLSICTHASFQRIFAEVLLSLIHAILQFTAEFGTGVVPSARKLCTLLLVLRLGQSDSGVCKTSRHLHTYGGRKCPQVIPIGSLGGSRVTHSVEMTASHEFIRCTLSAAFLSMQALPIRDLLCPAAMLRGSHTAHVFLSFAADVSSICHPPSFLRCLLCPPPRCRITLLLSSSVLPSFSRDGSGCGRASLLFPALVEPWRGDRSYWRRLCATFHPARLTLYVRGKGSLSPAQCSALTSTPSEKSGLLLVSLLLVALLPAVVSGNCPAPFPRFGTAGWKSPPLGN